MIIRTAVPSDARELAVLSGELGYASAPEAMRQRLERIAAREDHLVMVAVLDGELVAWIQTHVTESIEGGRRGEILGLLVTARVRRRGIGRMLVECAVQWAHTNGADTLVVRTNSERKESQPFYGALGFKLTKTQAVFRRNLRREPFAAAAV